MPKLTGNDKTCPHCGGEITLRWEGRIIYWCNICNTDDPNSPTIIDMTFPKEEVVQNQSAEGEPKFTQY